MTEIQAINTLSYLLGYENAVDKGELEGENHLNSQEKKALKFILDKVQHYREIGTVEEFKDLKEKNELKKPIDKSKNPKDWHIMACPRCEKVFWNSGQFFHYEPIFCSTCGQKIDWKGGTTDEG